MKKIMVTCVNLSCDGVEYPSRDRKGAGWAAARRPRSLTVAARICAVAIACLVAPVEVVARAPGEPQAATASPEALLSVQQQQIADKYKHLEEVLLRMTELTASTDPNRAALLRRTVAESKDRMVDVQFERMVRLLGDGRLSQAMENTKDLDGDLRAILELLLSENRAKQIASEKARLRAQIQQVGRILRQQKSIQGRTVGGGKTERLAGEQRNLADQTGKLAQDIRRADEAARGGAPKQDAAKDASPVTPKKKMSDEPSKRDETKKPGQANKKGEQGKPSQQGGKGPPQGESPTQPPDAKQPDTVPSRLDGARQKMRDAQAKLDKAARQGAVEDQEEAIRRLEQAKAELEEILRQLREEEIERMLTALQSRFKKMLDLQRAVYKDTQRLDKTPPDQRGHEHEIEASRLSQKESLLVLEADRALALLREDASSVALPEATAQMRDDMEQVALRLGRSDVGKITQTIEEAVIAALEEMIDALQREAEKQEERRRQPPPSSGQLQDPPLVDQLAELKMIRALQMRVNQRTARYSKLIDAEQAENPDLLEALRRLADYQSRICRITRDLEAGKEP